MTQQRLSLLWFPLVLLLGACSGGSGEMVEQLDPAAPPKTADQQPPIVSGNPSSARTPPPGASQPLPPDPSAPPSSVPPPGGGGGGDCATLCDGIRPECDRVDQNCVAECNQERQEPCGAENLALLICATTVACPEQLGDALFGPAVLARCSQELQAAIACDTANPEEP